MWDYNNKVMNHFLHPQNVGEVENPDGVGEVGNITCGDALKLTFKLDKNGRISDVKFKTFGCASAIASSSALTEIIKGMTIEEAEKVTNQDIVELLGELPEEKMHCSVMGMEALQAAIADYRGEASPVDVDDDHEGRIVCKCFGVTDNKIRKVALENKLHSCEEITNYCKAGGACGSCLDEIQLILDGLWKDLSKKPEESSGAKLDFMKLPLIQRVIKVQEVIDDEIKPMLEKDGGSIELIDMKENTIYVRLQGRCATCPTANVTLKHVVEDKLREFLFPELVVESIK
ncbi:Fe-S cluster assembly protein NifU [Lentisphaerota bacterium ZTH]|nr:Fe-S cluster assembly protein NifU [Lentisphaerota bacterium]WET06258.1 Fe-S cluster assembly protein NifU [Lentisphaerota bacterium ZTH]